MDDERQGASDDHGRPTSYAYRDGYGITISWGVVNGRAEPVDVRIEAYGGQIVNSEVLRRLPFGSIVADLRRGQGELHHAIVNHPSVSDEQRARSWSYMQQFGNELEGVAAIYREAYRLGLSPRQEIAEAYDISLSTAAKRIMAARKAGLLGPARPGKAGES